MGNRAQTGLHRDKPAAGNLSLGESLAEFPGFQRRQLKAAIALVGLWLVTLGLHLWVWGAWVVYGCTVCVGLHLMRLLFVPLPAAPTPLPLPGGEPSEEAWPKVSILVAAKNEEAVIGRLVRSLVQLQYPRHCLEIWMIDDCSTDQTPAVLADLAQRYPQVVVVRREENAKGGKSGALNAVWPQTQGDILIVFDADAQVAPDFLRQVIPWFDDPQVGAVQVRKAIANAPTNGWTRGQAAEMAFDAYCQRQRVAGGGVGELRGNGQLVRRSAIAACGGWNEVTITDDLDLTFRLHLTGWDIPVVIAPAVQEEGVTRWGALWHQRNRWAEGGYQRFLDYWRLLLSGRLGWRKGWDMFCFWLVQYALPTMAVPDLALAIARTRPPVLTPLSSVVATFLMVGMVQGIRLTRRQSPWQTLAMAIQGTLYMLHWLVVMPPVTLRMALRPKRLRWIKTEHQGLSETPWGELEATTEPGS